MPAHLAATDVGTIVPAMAHGHVKANITDWSHTHAPSEITGTAVVTNDSRLSDARTPTSHTHVKSEVGLGNVDNTSDAGKPVSTAQQAALDAKDIRSLAVLANDTLAQNYVANGATKLTVTANRTLTTTVPPAGSRRTTIILTSGATSFTITFGSGFKPTGTPATGTTTARVFVSEWVSDGTNLYESSRTVAMAA